MRLCIPTTNDLGLAGTISPHVGSAPYFTVVDPAGGRVEVVENRNAVHLDGTCLPIEDIRDLAVDALLCHRVGARAFARLRDAGVPVWLTERSDVAGAVDAFSAGSLRVLRAAEHCHGRAREAGGEA